MGLVFSLACLSFVGFLVLVYTRPVSEPVTQFPNGGPVFYRIQQNLTGESRDRVLVNLIVRYFDFGLTEEGTRATGTSPYVYNCENTSEWFTLTTFYDGYDSKASGAGNLALGFDFSGVYYAFAQRMALPTQICLAGFAPIASYVSTSVTYALLQPNEMTLWLCQLQCRARGRRKDQCTLEQLRRQLACHETHSFQTEDLLYYTDAGEKIDNPYTQGNPAITAYREAQLANLNASHWPPPLMPLSGQGLSSNPYAFYADSGDPGDSGEPEEALPFEESWAACRRTTPENQTALMRIPLLLSNIEQQDATNKGCPTTYLLSAREGSILGRLIYGAERTFNWSYGVLVVSPPRTLNVMGEPSVYENIDLQSWSISANFDASQEEQAWNIPAAWYRTMNALLPSGTGFVLFKPANETRDVWLKRSKCDDRNCSRNDFLPVSVPIRGIQVPVLPTPDSLIIRIRHENQSWPGRVDNLAPCCLLQPGIVDSTTVPSVSYELFGFSQAQDAETFIEEHARS